MCVGVCKALLNIIYERAYVDDVVLCRIYMVVVCLHIYDDAYIYRQAGTHQQVFVE